DRPTGDRLLPRLVPGFLDHPSPGRAGAQLLLFVEEVMLHPATDHPICADAAHAAPCDVAPARLCCASLVCVRARAPFTGRGLFLALTIAPSLVTLSLDAPRRGRGHRIRQPPQRV